ncbi:MAG: nicotinate-nucleotide--dimethylbenzimidazole phosphoribosyltransferase [Eubacterium sp.]|nr:nicotinate-nucleotide--dimethylbenzimidazole phosphoribosyltransferase [Eubacterium sp.]
MKIKQKEELFNIDITKLDEAVMAKVKAKWDYIAKPLDSLGAFEDIFVKIGGICGTDAIDVSPAYTLVMCADNGIIEEGVTQTGSYVTQVVAGEMGMGKSLSSFMAQSLGAEFVTVDCGMEGETPAGVKNKKVRAATRNFKKEPAMTESEVLAAVNIGIEEVEEIKEKGGKLILIGEMGIGNTTTSSAVISAISGYFADKVTGRGAGLSDGALEKKMKIIDEAIEKYGLRNIEDDKNRAFEALRCVGGLDIAALCGVCIGGALYKIPIVLDGLITLAAALCAENMIPGVKDYLIPSHIGKERGAKLVSTSMGFSPVIDAQMALGEGSGALMLYSLLKVTEVLYKSGTEFDDMGVTKYERFS